jgi:hypothetical protein
MPELGEATNRRGLLDGTFSNWVSTTPDQTDMFLYKSLRSYRYMKLLLIFVSVVLLSSTVMVGQGSYGLDYYIGGRGQPFGGDGFHGPHSVRLDYDQKIRYVRIDLEEPLSFEELNDFCVNMKLITANGKIGIDLYLDGDGDGKWKSKSSSDVKLYARPDEWQKIGWPIGEWIGLDAFVSDYKKSGDPSFGEMNLADWKEELGGDLEVVQIYIRLYMAGHGICLFDYFNINGMILSFEPNEGPYEKAGKPKRISQNGKITYTITYGNDFNTTLTNFVIVEEYDPRMTLLSADPPPDPGTANVWTIGNVSPGRYGRIVLVMKMKKQNFVADVDGRVSGAGFVSVRRRFTTNRDPHLIVNNVRISCDQFERWGRVETPVRPIVRTTLSFSEHGSGSYESEEVLSYRTTRLKMNRELNATWTPSILNLSFGRAIGYNSSWYASHFCMDEKRGSIIREQYLYADWLNCTGVAEVRSTRLILGSESNFSGMAIYDIESHTKDRDALLTNVFEGSYSLRSGAEIYK